VLNIAVGSKINVGDSEVQSYYDRHMKSANIQVRASHIFIAHSRGRRQRHGARTRRSWPSLCWPARKAARISPSSRANTRRTRARAAEAAT